MVKNAYIFYSVDIKYNDKKWSQSFRNQTAMIEVKAAKQEAKIRKAIRQGHV